MEDLPLKIRLKRNKKDRKTIIQVKTGTRKPLYDSFGQDYHSRYSTHQKWLWGLKIRQLDHISRNVERRKVRWKRKTELGGLLLWRKFLERRFLRSWSPPYQRHSFRGQVQIKQSLRRGNSLNRQKEDRRSMGKQSPHPHFLIITQSIKS